MKAEIPTARRTFKVDLSKGINLSLELSASGVRAWYVDPLRIAPVINRFFCGSVKAGGSVNFNDIRFNPHGHGTHTETVGHITPELISINEVLQNGFFDAVLISLYPEVVTEENAWRKKGDRMITQEMIEQALSGRKPQALLIRTMPNSGDKTHCNYSSTNFPYLAHEACAWLAETGVDHLLVDLPSVDREEDGGLLLAHRAFWQYPHEVRKHATITELIYAGDEVTDGEYLLQITTAPFANDAAPSRVILYKPE